jgi:NADH:ubiquinone oxidoreductase subunit F (NADH-binding)
MKDIDNLKYLAENMLGRTFCPLGDAAAMPIISYVRSSGRSLKTTSTASRARMRRSARR